MKPEGGGTEGEVEEGGEGSGEGGEDMRGSWQF